MTDDRAIAAIARVLRRFATSRATDATGYLAAPRHTPSATDRGVPPRPPTVQGARMTGLPTTALDAAMDAIERLGAGGSRTTVRIVLDAAAPHIAAAERERIRQLALTEADQGAKTGLDRIALRAFAERLTEGTPT